MSKLNNSEIIENSPNSPHQEKTRIKIAGINKLINPRSLGLKIVKKLGKIETDFMRLCPGLTPLLGNDNPYKNLMMKNDSEKESFYSNLSKSNEILLKTPSLKNLANQYFVTLILEKMVTPNLNMN